MQEPSIEILLFDGNQLQVTIDGLSLDLIDLAGRVPMSPRALQQWINFGEGKKQEIKKIQKIINIEIIKQGKEDLIITDDFFKVSASTESEIPCEDSSDEKNSLAAKCLYAARRSVNAAVAREGLNQAIIYTKNGSNEVARIILARSYSELAKRTSSRSNRKKMYEMASAAIDYVFFEIYCTIESAQLALDVVGDAFSGLTNPKKKEIINKARERVHEKIKNSVKDIKLRQISLLYCKSSALTRASVRISYFSKFYSRTWLTGASHAVRDAIQYYDDPGARLEAILVRWQKSQYVETELEYISELRGVAADFKKLNQTRSSIFSLIAEAQFYRHNFRPLIACRIFGRIPSQADRYDILLSKSHIYGDAAVMLSESMPSRESRRHIGQAQRLITQCVISGLASAHHFGTNLRLQYKMYGLSAEKHHLIVQLCARLEAGGDDLAAIVRDAIRDAKADPLSEAFAVGIGSCECLCSLGTVISADADKYHLAIRMYKLAVRANGHSPTPHTNLARLLLRHTPVGWDHDALNHLKMAETLGGFRFTWWRHLMYEWQTSVGKRNHVQNLAPLNVQSIRHCKSISELRSLVYSRLVSLLSTSSEISSLVVRLAELTFAIVYIKERRDPFRVEIDVYDARFVIYFSTEAKAEIKSMYSSGSKKRYGVLVVSSADAHVSAAIQREPAEIYLDFNDILQILNESVQLDAVLYMKILSKISI